MHLCAYNLDLTKRFTFSSIAPSALPAFQLLMCLPLKSNWPVSALTT